MVDTKMLEGWDGWCLGWRDSQGSKHGLLLKDLVLCCCSSLAALFVLLRRRRLAWYQITFGDWDWDWELGMRLSEWDWELGETGTTGRGLGLRTGGQASPASCELSSTAHRCKSAKKRLD